MPLRDVEVRKVSSALTTLANEKQKEQRDKSAGKKKTKGSAKPGLGAAKVANKCVMSCSLESASLIRYTGWTQVYMTRHWMTLGPMQTTSCDCDPREYNSVSSVGCICISTEDTTSSNVKSRFPSQRRASQTLLGRFVKRPSWDIKDVT